MKRAPIARAVGCFGLACAVVSCRPYAERSPYHDSVSPANTRNILVYGDEKYLLAVGTDEGWGNGFLCVHDLDQGRILSYEKWPQDIEGLAISPPGSRIATGDWDGIVTIWNVEAHGKLSKGSQLGLGSPVLSLCWPADGILVAGTKRGTLFLLRAAPLEQVRTLDGHTDWIISLEASPGGRYVASGGRDGKLIVWDTATWSRAHEFPCRQWPREIRWGPHGEWLVAVYSHDLLKTERPASAPSTSPALVPGMLRAWRTDTWEQVYEYSTESDNIRMVRAAFMPPSLLTIFDIADPRSRQPSRAFNVELATGNTQALPWATVPHGGTYFAHGSRLVARSGAHTLAVYRISSEGPKEIWRGGHK